MAAWLVEGRHDLAVVQQTPTHEKLGITFAKTNVRLCEAVNESPAHIKESGLFDALCNKWFGDVRKG